MDEKPQGMPAAIPAAASEQPAENAALDGPQGNVAGKNDKPAGPRTLVYMPLASDKDETESAGIQFKAYELTELPPGKAFLADRFAANPWFAQSLEAVDPQRMANWAKARRAAPDAAEAQADAERLHKAAAEAGK